MDPDVTVEEAFVLVSSLADRTTGSTGKALLIILRLAERGRRNPSQQMQAVGHFQAASAELKKK